MRSRSLSGGQHELGQNFLHHPPTIRLIIDEVRHTDGAILEIGPGDGALTRPLARLGRPVTAIEIDEHRVAALRRRLPEVTVLHDDATRARFTAPVVVGNLPFHLTTPLMRALLRQPRWRHAVLVTQWEVARKRAGVGGGTLLSAQSAPWYEFRLAGRVPAAGFHPMPSVDGGILAIERRERPLLANSERSDYERWVRRVFAGRGGRMTSMLREATPGCTADAAARALSDAGVKSSALPRSVTPEQWVRVWRGVGGSNRGRGHRSGRRR